MAFYKITTKDKIEVFNAVSYGQAELIFAKHGNPKDIIKIEIDDRELREGNHANPTTANCAIFDVSNCKLCETSMCKHRTYKDGKSVCKTSNDNCVYYC